MTKIQLILSILNEKPKEGNFALSQCEIGLRLKKI